jgi:hypothetical protein
MHTWLYYPHKLHVASSPGCNRCICAGYIRCLYRTNQVSPDYSSLWWQTREDGSKHDRRSDEDYLELLELGLDGNAEEVCQGMDWKAWEICLGSLEISWTESPDETHTKCRRHGSTGGLKRIHKYILYH